MSGWRVRCVRWGFGLPPLTDRDLQAEAPLEAFDFAAAPRPPIELP